MLKDQEMLEMSLFACTVENYEGKYEEKGIIDASDCVNGLIDTFYNIKLCDISTIATKSVVDDG